MRDMKSNITKKIIKAIKQCDYLGFRLTDRDTCLEAGKRENYNDPFPQRSIFSEPISTVIDDYSGKDGQKVIEHFGQKKTNFTGWADQENWSGRPNPVMLLSNILKEGDCLVARWLINNSSDWTKRKSLVNDVLHLEIYRFNKRKNDWICIGAFEYKNEVEDLGSPIRMIKVKRL